MSENGSTHQPVEHLAARRSTPNLPLWSPPDPRETAAAWRAALLRGDRPVALALTRQNLPSLEGDGVEEKVRRGGYVADDG